MTLQLSNTVNANIAKLTMIDLSVVYLVFFCTKNSIYWIAYGS